jgi:hypothetical protein
MEYLMLQSATLIYRVCAKQLNSVTTAGKPVIEFSFVAKQGLIVQAL